MAFAFGCYPRLFHDEGKRRGVFERDRVITLTATVGTLPFSWASSEIRRPAELVVDCRNRNEKYGADDVADWITRMRESDSQMALVVAVSGITTQTSNNAKEAIRAAWLQDRLMIGVVSGGDLRRVCDQSEPVGWLEIVHASMVSSRHGRRHRS